MITGIVLLVSTIILYKIHSKELNHLVYINYMLSQEGKLYKRNETLKHAALVFPVLWVFILMYFKSYRKHRDGYIDKYLWDRGDKLYEVRDTTEKKLFSIVIKYYSTVTVILLPIIILHELTKTGVIVWTFYMTMTVISIISKIKYKRIHYETLYTFYSYALVLLITLISYYLYSCNLGINIEGIYKELRVCLKK